MRPLWVYLPPAYDAEPDRRFPSIYLIQGMTGQLDMWRNRTAFRPSTPGADRRALRGGRLPARARRLRRLPGPRYGGSQFIDSPGTGRYGEYLCDEIVSFVDERYRTLAEAAHRGLTGKSSGGYGAMVVPMLRPDVFGGLATHAGDALFELCYLPEFRDTARASCATSYDGSYDRFWEDFRSRPAFTKRFDHILLNTYAMAACYSANEDGSVDLPFDLTTGMLRDDVWQRWLAWDPVRMARRHADALRSLRAIYIDAGTRDEWFLDLGADAFRRELEALGITDVFFELFDASHGGIEYRYPLAIRYLAERLQ